MTRLSLLFLSVLVACGDDECTRATVDVADDDPLGDLPFTAAEVLAAVTGTRTVPLSGAGGSTVNATLTVTRGEGPAVLTDATLREGFDGLGSHDYDLFYCYDEVEVPVVLDLATADGATVVRGATSTAFTSMVFHQGDEDDLGIVSMVGVPGADDVLTPPASDARPPRLNVNFLGKVLTDISLTWQADDGVQRELAFVSGEGG